jgi:DNA invertase Pin-like site-specific DNA recombinase
MRAIIYARCSTDESRQDVEVQLKQLRDYCSRNGWEHDEVFEYGSGSKGTPPKLQQVLDLVAQRVYDVMIVHSLDRFSRQEPSTTEKMLNFITDCKCRFISIAENLDSDNQMIWYCFKGVWMYFSNQYSKKLSEKVKLGMANARAKGIHVGRPKGSTDKKQRSKKGYYTRRRKFNLNSGVNTR